MRFAKFGITQSAILSELKTFRSVLNNKTAVRNEAITINFDSDALLDLQVRNFTLVRSSTSRLKSFSEYYFALKADDDGNLEFLRELIRSILRRELGD